MRYTIESLRLATDSDKALPLMDLINLMGQRDIFIRAIATTRSDEYVFTVSCEKENIVDFLKTLGYHDDDVAHIVDHDMVLDAEYATAWDKLAERFAACKAHTGISRHASYTIEVMYSGFRSIYVELKAWDVPSVQRLVVLGPFVSEAEALLDAEREIENAERLTRPQP